MVALHALMMLLLACAGPGKDLAADSQDSAAAASCEAPAGGYALPSGSYMTSIDAELFNRCENEAGRGLHIHVGEDTPMELVVDGGCVAGEASGMSLAGHQDGERLTLEGVLEQVIGTCTVGITASMQGTLTADGAFDYRMDAVADVYAEVVEGACELIVGDTENHTYPALPCEQAWEGRGWIPEQR